MTADSSNRVVSSKKQRHTKVPMALLYTLIGLCLCIAWFSPVRHALSNRLWPSAKSGPRDSHQFIALSYGASCAPENLDINQLDKHLDTLSANGFSPISLDDAIKLINKNQPVPRKAILLTINTTNHKTVVQAERIVRKHGWQAALVVSFQPIAEHAKGAISWKQLRELEKATNWSIVSCGYVGSKKVQTGPKKSSTGNFLTSRCWLAQAGRLETPEEFQTRVVADHRAAIEAQEKPKALGHPLHTYAYPAGDFGQTSAPGDFTGRINLTIAKAWYSAAFIDGSIGLNSAFSDASRLNRLSVSPKWSAADLLHAIDRNLSPVTTLADSDFTTYNSGWIADWGEVTTSSNGIISAAYSTTKGSRAWVAGSDLHKNFNAHIRFLGLRGNFITFLRCHPYNTSYLKLEIGSDGQIYLKEKTARNASEVTLASDRIALRAGHEHRLDIFVRDQFLQAILDGKNLFNQSVRVSTPPEAGRLSIGCMANTPGKACVTVTAAKILNCSPALASWPEDNQNERYIVDWVHRNSGSLTELSPPWQTVCGAKQAQSDTPASVYKLLAKIYHLRFTPHIDINSDGDMQHWSPPHIAESANEFDCDGVYVNFATHPNLQVAPLEKWLRQTSRMFSGKGRALLVRLPPMLERLATVNSIIATIPAVELVTSTNTKLPLPASAPPIKDNKIATPSKKELAELPPLFAISTKSDSTESPIQARIRKLRDEAEGAFSRGAYERAIAAFSEWHQIEPSAARPLTRIGDALVELGYNEEAVIYYRQSLNLDPGQVTLAMRQARLLTELNRKTEAKNLLNAYARLFPNSVDVLFAQADWLYRQDRNAEARQRIDRILSLDENNFDACFFLLRLANDETSRTYAVDRLMSLSATPERHYDIVNAVWQYDLLTLPNSHLLINILNDIDTASDDPRVKNIISKLQPRTSPVSATYSKTNSLSDAWQLQGATSAIADDKLTIRANAARSEFTLRLLRSERWRDCFAEATVDSVNGGFWLYARRSRNHLIRFGFDQKSDRIYLQAWRGRNNNMIINRFVPWTKPDNPFTLRLEVRGNGIQAIINGKPAFDTPLPIPNNFGLGRVALAVNATERGNGSVTLTSIKAGPLPVRLALLPADPDKENADQQLKLLREKIGSITDFSPDWFAVGADGSWSSHANIDNGFFRLFARYYRVRMVPTVRVAAGAEIIPQDIITIARIHDFDGLVLIFDDMPSDKWFRRMDRELSAPGLFLLAVVIDDVSGEASMRGIAASRTLFQDAGTVEGIPVINSNEQTGQKDGSIEKSVILTF